MRKSLKKEILAYANANPTVTDDELDVFIRGCLSEFEIPTKIVYYAETKNLLRDNGFTHWNITIPIEWLNDRNRDVRQKNKTQQFLEFSKDDVFRFMTTHITPYNPYVHTLKLLIASGRRLCEIYHTDFELRNNRGDAKHQGTCPSGLPRSGSGPAVGSRSDNGDEIWYIPYKKRGTSFMKIREFTFDYTPKQFIEELQRVRNCVTVSFQSFRANVSAVMNCYFNTSKIHKCRSMYALLLIDKYEIKPNQMLYYVSDWLCHDNISSSNRYVQIKWAEKLKTEGEIVYEKGISTKHNVSRRNRYDM